MPNHKFHISLGLLLFFSYFILNQNIKIYIFLPIAIVYSILPDIDISNSKIGKIARNILVFLSIIFITLSLIKNFKLIYSLIPLIFLAILQLVPHRKFFHTIKASILLSLPLIIIGLDAFVFGVLNYLVHLIADKKIKLRIKKFF